MNYGFEEKPSGFARFVGFAFAFVAGALAGFLAELVVTAVTDTLVAALPAASGAGRVALYLGLSAIPAAIFASLVRSRRATASARALGVAALAVLVILVAGELTRTIVLDRTHTPFYVVPA